MDTNQDSPGLGSEDAGTIPLARHPFGFSSAAVFGAILLVQAVSFAGLVVLYKLIGVSAQGQALLGTIQLFFLISYSISSVGDLRFGSAFTFFIARGKSPKDSTSTYLALRFVIAGFAGALLLVVGTLDIGGQTLAPTPELIGLLGAFLALPFLWSLPSVYTQLNVARGDSIRAQYPSLVEIGVRTSLLVWAAVFDPTPWGITSAYVLGAAASAAYSTPALLTQLDRFRRSEALLMFRFAWPLMGSLSLSYVATNAMPFLVEAAAGVRELNIFNAVNGFRVVALSFATAVATPLFPLVSGLHQRRAYSEVRVRTVRALRYTSMVVIPGSLALALYSKVLLEVFTAPSYFSGTEALAILAVSVVPASLSVIIYTTLVGIGRQRLELYISGLQVVTLFGGAAVLLPPVSAVPSIGVLTAAALVILISSCTGLVLNLYFLSTLISPRVPWRSLTTISICSVTGLGLGMWFDTRFIAGPLVQLTLGLVGGLAAVLALGILVGELTKQDVRFIVASLRLPPSWGDFIARLCWKEHSPDFRHLDDGAPLGVEPVELGRR